MKHICWWLIRHNHLPDHSFLRRPLLDSIFRPVGPRDIDAGLEGWYDLGYRASPEMVENFRAWMVRG